MTVQELKSYFSQFNIKPKTNIPDDYTVTIEDIIKGSIFQKFIDNDSFTRIVSGLNVIDGNICYTYPVLDRIEIHAEEDFPPCGGKEELNVYAYYSIYSIDTNGFTNVISSERHSLIHTLITLDNDLFKYEKPYLVNKEANYSENNIEVNIHAIYYNKAVKYDAVKHIVQHINKNTPWLVEKEPTQFIKLSLSKGIMPKEGGITQATVERGFSRIYHMKDSCGNVVGGKSEIGLTENITEKCLITCNNKKDVSILKNTIKVEPQEIEEKEKSFIITARYLDFTSSAELLQEEGGKITYKKELSFDDGKPIKFVDLETSLPTTKPIYIVSKTLKYIDGVYDGYIYEPNLSISSDKEWASGKIIKTDDGIILNASTTETNIDKNNDREAVLTISNGKDSIKLILSQQSLSVIDEEYHCDYVGENHFTYKELKNGELYFKPYKLLIYEGYTGESVDIEPDIKVSAICVSSNSSLLNLTRLDKEGERYFLNFFNQAKNSISDINLKITPIFLSGSTKIFSGKEIILTVEGTDVIDYNYELCFDKHNKFKAIKWRESTTPAFINYNSWKYTLTNGKITNKEIIPTKISIYNEKGEEYFDDTFSVKLLSDKIMAFPVKTDKNIRKKYVITQKETGKKIDLELRYEKNVVTRSIPLKVIVYSDNVTYDIWTGDNGYLLIDEDTIVKLTPCWLSPTMADKKDNAFNGTITINEGEHLFEAVNIVLLTQKGEYNKIDCKKTIDINSSTKEILFEIKCP